MADILQAGKWLESGKRVRRSTWLHRAYIGPQSGVLTGKLIGLFWTEGPIKHEGEFVLSISDLTTEDWEVAE